MESLATFLGKFLGLILAELAPVIVEIIRATKNTVEDSNPSNDLRSRLLNKLRSVENGIRPSTGSDKTEGNG